METRQNQVQTRDEKVEHIQKELEKRVDSSLSSCMYPLSGIVFMLKSPPLRQIVLHFLLVVTSISLGITIAAFIFLWNIHMHYITGLFQYISTARVVTAFLLLAESAIPVAIVYTQKFEEVQHQLFDETLKLKRVQPAKSTELETRELKNLAQHPPEHRTVKEPQYMRYIVQPLNAVYQVLFVPKLGQITTVARMRVLADRTVGTFLPFLIPVLAFRDGSFLAADLMKRYWNLKGVSDDEALKALQSKYAWEYRGFGVVAAALTYIPILSWALGLTNSVGAALLAATLEERGIKQS